MHFRLWRYLAVPDHTVFKGTYQNSLQPGELQKPKNTSPLLEHLCGYNVNETMYCLSEYWVFCAVFSPCKKLLFTPYWGWQWGPLFAVSESMPSQWQTEKQELINCISKFQLQFYPGFSSRITQLPQLWLHTTCNIYQSSLRQEKCCLYSSTLFFPKLCPPTYNCWGEGEEEKRKKEAKEARFVDISPL